jgi:hypothetical protein
VPVSSRWVLTTGAVQRAIEDLRSRSIHPFFVAYLHLRQRAAAQGTTSGLRPRWKAGLGPYLEVDGAPATHPYYRPFWDGAGEAGQEWLNGNLAGSFAGSSLRAGSPPMLVVDYDPVTRTFALREQHWELALEHLLRGRPLPAEALAAFLLRDFAFDTDSDDPPTGDDLVALFGQEFGYRDRLARIEFERLYQPTGAANAVWFERFGEETR